MTKIKTCAAAIIFYSMLYSSVLGQTSVSENPVHVETWNRFVNSLYAVHQHYKNNYKIRSSEVIGGYSGLPNYYREVSIYHHRSGKLLSRIRWELDKPENIHVIEIYVYDEDEILVRDYVAAYLPDFRNAPHQTLINFHQFNDGLRAMRQFDASGNRLYEHCSGKRFDEKILIAIDEPLIATPEYLLNNDAYTACFGFLPLSPGRYLYPSEILITNRDVPINEQEQLEFSIAKLSLRLKFSPDNADLYLQRGQRYFQLLKFDAAIKDLTKAIHLNVKIDKAYFWRGMALGRIGLIDEGIDDLSKYIARNPDSSLAYTKRGVRHIWKGDFKSAEIDLMKAIALDPSNAEAHDDLGVVLARRGKHEAAITHFLQTIKINPNYQKAHHNLALVLYVRGMHAEALKRIEHALLIGPDTQSSLKLKATILKALGRHDETENLSKQIKQAPKKNWSENLEVN